MLVFALVSKDVFVATSRLEGNQSRAIKQARKDYLFNSTTKTTCTSSTSTRMNIRTKRHRVRHTEGVSGSKYR